MALALLGGPARAATDFKIGPDADLDSAAVAAGTDRYLIVWRDLRNGSGSPRIYGATVSAAGLVSADFPISDAAGMPVASPMQRPTVAFDGTNFLVLWSDARTVGAGVRGMRVSPQGALVDAADFLIAATARTTSVAPQVVFTGTDYCAAWQDSSSSPAGGTQVYCARVSTAGVPGAALAQVHTGSTTPAQSLEFLAAGPSNEALIVFQNAAQTPTETRATRVAFNNTAVSPAEGALLFQRDFSTQGFGAPIGLAYDGTQYIVLSSHGAQMDSSVFRTRLPADGQVIRPSGSFAEVGQGDTGLDEDDFPRAFYNNSSEFLFMRNSKVSETAYHILSKRVQLDGKDRDPNLPLLDSASQGVLNGAMAAAIGSQYLVIWMDGRRSPFQPGRQTNIYGALLDGAQTGDETKPYIKAVGHARPIFGSSPLLAGFDTGGSSGIVDSIGWDFGDGNASTTGYTTHTYQSKGDYVAVLSLVRAGFVLHDFVRILVDSEERGGAGGPPQSIGGALGPQSADVCSDIFMTSFQANLNFAAPNLDSTRFFGYFDPSVLPVTLKDKSGALTIGSRAYAFTLDAYGYYTTVDAKPVVRFQINPYTGAFTLVTSYDELQSILVPLGATDESTGKTGKEVSVPFKLVFEDLTLESTLTTQYVATAGKQGRLVYYFRTSGQPGAGFFHIFGAKAAETGNPGALKHDFSLAGNAGFGGTQQMDKAETGRFKITLGNYTEEIDVTSLKVSDNLLGYLAPKGAKGIKSLVYNKISGSFFLEFKGVDAEGDNPSGMALSSSPYARADMALSLDLDLSDGRNYQGSGYVRLSRKKAGAKKWGKR
jgi:PKD repeat protein